MSKRGILIRYSRDIRSHVGNNCELIRSLEGSFESLGHLISEEYLGPSLEIFLGNLNFEPNTSKLFFLIFSPISLLRKEKL